MGMNNHETLPAAPENLADMWDYQATNMGRYNMLAIAGYGSPAQTPKMEEWSGWLFEYLPVNVQHTLAARFLYRYNSFD